MDKKPIYVISLHNSKVRDTRPVGFYYDLEVAKKVIAVNTCDLHENYYNYLILEEIHEGIFVCAKVKVFYEWQTDRWVEIENPTPDVINWGIG